MLYVVRHNGKESLDAEIVDQNAALTSSLTVSFATLCSLSADLFIVLVVLFRLVGCVYGGDAV